MATITEAMVLANQYFEAASYQPAEQIYRRVLDANPEQALAWHQLGLIGLRLNKADVALGCVRKAIQLRPRNAIFHNSLGATLERLGQLSEAEQSFKTAIELKADLHAAHFNLGNVLRSQKRIAEAQASYEHAIDLSPRAEYYVNLGVLLKESKRPGEAIAAFRRAIDLKPDFADAYVNLGAVLQSSQLLDEALACYRQAQTVCPGLPNAVGGEGAILHLQGKLDLAYAAIRPLVESGNASPEIAVVFAGLSPRFGKSAEALSIVDKVLSERNFAAHQRSPLLFAAANLNDRLGNYDRAFERYREANASASSGSFAYEALAKHVDALIATFSEEFMASCPRATNCSEVPVFIVGMPRSGTSLVEQILASHPRLFGAGELRLFHEFTVAVPGATPSKLPYPACLKEVTRATLDELSTAYLSHLQSLSDAERVTDKMPGNFFHLGFIKMLFPNARIIHVARHPLDTCLSCYFQAFNVGHEFTYDLTHLGKVYRLYQKMMAHWRSISLPFLDIQYEELVRHQEEESRRLIEFCGLDWDERCLHFHKTDRPVKTASHDQVRQPLYERSIGRYKHYARHLNELTTALEISEAQT